MEKIVCVAIAVMLFLSSYSAKAEELDQDLKAAEQNLSSIESTKEIRK
jgi:hypothetical protein